MENEKESLPQILLDYIDVLVQKAGGSRKVRLEVHEELRHHFIDALAAVQDDATREKSAQELIDHFGDMDMLAKLINRGKKRCRPLWQKVLFRGLTALGACVVFMIVYMIWFLNGRPTMSVDYLARLNAMTNPAVAVDKNAWPDYEQAIATYVKPDEVDRSRGLPDTTGMEAAATGIETDPAGKKPLINIVNQTPGNPEYRAYRDLQGEEWEAVTEWLNRNEKAWGHFVAASRKPYCYRPYDVGKQEGHPMLLAVVLPHISELRDIARMGAWLSDKQMHDRNAGGAAETCLTLVRAGRHWQESQGTLIEQLVGSAVIRLGLRGIGTVTADGDLSSAQLANVQRDLAAVFKNGYPHVNMATERLMFEDMVQHSFTDGGPGGGHIVPKMFAMVADGISMSGSDDPDLVYMGAGLIHAGRKKTLELATRLYDRMDQTVKVSPYELHSGKVQEVDAILEAHNKWRYSFVYMIVPAVRRVAALRYQSKATYEAMLAVLAARRWQLDKGAPPDSLAQLNQAGYLDQVPADPYSAEPLRYAARDNDFVLYSLGEDFDDDGGKQDAEETWGRGDPGGDRVFWPVG